MTLEVTSTQTQAYAGLAGAYQEAHRPQLSYSPARNWMNDPNGLVYYDGEYHLFYQYNPNDTVWGDMSWGHAVSADLLHWTELPVALEVEKDGQGAITQSFYSGSAVVDRANSSGLGSPGQVPMVIIYTSVYPEARTLANGTQVQAGQQSQSLAFSVDRGRHWTQFSGNPVLALPPHPYRDELREFRDPKVFWHAPQSKWVMVVALAHRHTILLYCSRDLIEWEYMSQFGPAGATGGVWECPDLFPLPLDGDDSNNKWVLVVNLTPGGPAGGSGAQYFLGHFDGSTFRPDAGDACVRWLDQGPDFYAAVTWNDAPDGRRLLIGWMSNWLYARTVPTSPWRSAQSVPRELSLRTVAGQVRLVQQPVQGFDSLRRDTLLAIDDVSLAAGVDTLPRLRTAGVPVDIELVLACGSATRAGVQVHANAAGDRTEIGYDCERGELYIDRGRAGAAPFSADFAACHGAPLALVDGVLRLRILVDRAAVTVFAGAGELTMTSLVFPADESDGIALFVEGGQARLRQWRVRTLASIWPAPHE